MVKKFIQKAIKRPGALRKAMGAKEGKTIPTKKLNMKISSLQKQAKGEKKLPASKLRLLKEAILARTLRKFKTRKAA